MVDEGWLEKLDKSAIPNIDNLVEALRKPAVRPRPRRTRLPWQSGMTGIAYNSTLTSAADHLDRRSCSRTRS